MSFNFCWSSKLDFDSKFCCSIAASLVIAASINSLSVGADCAWKTKGNPMIAAITIFLNVFIFDVLFCWYKFPTVEHQFLWHLSKSRNAHKKFVNELYIYVLAKAYLLHLEKNITNWKSIFISIFLEPLKKSHSYQIQMNFY